MPFLKQQLFSENEILIRRIFLPLKNVAYVLKSSVFGKLCFWSDFKTYLKSYYGFDLGLEGPFRFMADVDFLRWMATEKCITFNKTQIFKAGKTVFVMGVRAITKQCDLA